MANEELEQVVRFFHLLYTVDVLYESEHVPISVSLADTLNREPEHIMDERSKRLIERFWESLQQPQGLATREAMQTYLSEDMEYLSQPQQELICEWCEQVSVLGYNSDRYDQRLTRQHFVTKL